ncbi:hypothetical protein HJG60_008680 [Phyllostomus discolor]|uniref:Uncharacterized protein n=1 Tax=Phyllostomus discolor TaxID=89673 RepID=A0A833Z0M4_9CHIR|nr:hypothetical protein HJG60_008680 [Phyllostomus discolor]
MNLSDFLKLFSPFLSRCVPLSSDSCAKPWRHTDKFHVVLACKGPGAWCQRQGGEQKILVLWCRDAQLRLLWGKGGSVSQAGGPAELHGALKEGGHGMKAVSGRAGESKILRSLAFCANDGRFYPVACRASLELF